MKIIEIHYERVNSLGNYETERMKAIATISLDDNPAKAFKALKKWVEIQLGKRKKPSKKTIECAKNVLTEVDEWDEDIFWENS